MIEELKKFIVRDEYDLDVFNKKLETLMKKRFPHVLECVTRTMVSEKTKYGLGVGFGENIVVNVYLEKEFSECEDLIQKEFRVTASNELYIGAKLGVTSSYNTAFKSQLTTNPYEIQENIRRSIEQNMEKIHVDYYPSIRGNKVSVKDLRFKFDLEYWENLKVYVDFEKDKDELVNNHERSFSLRMEEYGPEYVKQNMEEEEFSVLDSTIKNLKGYQSQIHILTKKIENFNKLVDNSLESLYSFESKIEKIKDDFADKVTKETNESLNRNLARLREEHFKDS